MPIRALLDEAQGAERPVFGPEDLMAIVAAYERALERLNIAVECAPGAGQFEVSDLTG